MNIRQLRNFVRVVELGSVSRAARDVHIAQPALSQQIATLERVLEVPLLIRDPRGIRPTEAGERVYEAAQSIIAELERVTHEVRSSGQEPAGLVSIGFPPSMAATLGVPLLRELRDRFPKVALQITESVTGGLKELLLQRRLDVAILVNESASRDVAAHTLMSGSLFLVAPSGFKAGARRARGIRLADYAGKPFVLPRKVVPYRQRLDDALADTGMKLNVVMEIDSISTVKAAVEAGLGWTILPWYALHGREERLVARRIVDPPVRWDVSVCTRDRVPTGHAVTVVLSIVPQIVRDLAKKKTWPGDG